MCVVCVHCREIFQFVLNYYWMERTTKYAFLLSLLDHTLLLWLLKLMSYMFFISILLFLCSVLSCSCACSLFKWKKEHFLLLKTLCLVFAILITDCFLNKTKRERKLDRELWTAEKIYSIFVCTPFKYIDRPCLHKNRQSTKIILAKTTKAAYGLFDICKIIFPLWNVN